jgi:hypothetical protein
LKCYQQLHDLRCSPNENEVLSNNLKKKNERFLKENHSLKEAAKYENNQSVIVNKITHLLSPYFSDTQIKFFLNPDKKITAWTDDDIACALTIRSVSAKCYGWTRKHLKIPLPAVSSTLNRWVQDISLEPGLLTTVVEIMKAKGKKMRPVDRVTVLSFDEMKVNQIYSYDRGTDRI